MTSQHCILTCGRDASLLDTRRMLLESAGYRVLVATNPTSIVQILLNEPIELMVLCHTFSAQECLAILAAMHSSHPEASILSLQANKAPCGSGDGVQAINIFEGPKKLLARIQELIDVTTLPDQQRETQLTPHTA